MCVVLVCVVFIKFDRQPKRMSDIDALKAEANTQMRAGAPKKAAVLYTRALKVAPDSRELLANRSAAFGMCAF